MGVTDGEINKLEWKVGAGGRWKVCIFTMELVLFLIGYSMTICTIKCYSCVDYLLLLMNMHNFIILILTTDCLQAH